jgi:acetyl esterase/lipase
MKKKLTALLLSITMMALLLAGYGQTAQNPTGSNAPTESSASSSNSEPTNSGSLRPEYVALQKKEGEYSLINADTSLVDIMNHPAFEGFGQFIFHQGRAVDDIPLRNMGGSYFDVETSVKVINSMIEAVDNGQTIFYDIYSDEEKTADPRKKNTGLFFFRGEKGAPFAVNNAGGAFAIVASLQGSFPHASVISEKGYNAFALQYRTGGAEVACEDLAAAISFIFDNAEELGVSTEDYSLWGNSAGARMAAYLGSYGPAEYGGDDLPRAAAVIMECTGHTDYTENDPPTFAIIGENDGIASPATMERRINVLKAAGIDTEFRIYPGLGHFFCLGIGTVAEGWIYDAIAFWEKQMEGH